MIEFKDASQVRLQLKMKFSLYAWYKSSAVVSDADGYSIVISVNQLDNKVRKIIPTVVNNVSVRAELS